MLIPEIKIETKLFRKPKMNQNQNVSKAITKPMLISLSTADFYSRVCKKFNFDFGKMIGILFENLMFYKIFILGQIRSNCSKFR